ncbi:MAG: lipid A biosynthesis lauroyl acyltransferase [Sulfurimonas sp.]|uniref:lipid A biosynthesis lauroyl acyltransferase n=1 Tax=Sulfurimonas sp. TaxID=2022749 RepID=UPI0026167FC3|nr:lipid A biosynthesis lauroyl acyltransferase [Sulfurimonas sp.]MCW8895844.1 lipid A biosynthesis lauroyl acyltransferase [Sulfurimonas sp.]MCW8955197.1 lipid A biosynthesis lauroyl acyltransferase [Sulfurimonas sp.]MCW9068363.1 lipid A biosynthesis lauroyl acyltransferase [Sulfurimonas sp.]
MGFKLFLLLEKILMILPKSFRKGFFSMLATIAYYASSRYRNIAYKNLDFVFGSNMSDDEKKEITKYSFKNLLFNFLHLIEIKHMSKEDLAKKVTIQNIQAVQKAHKDGRAVIYVTPHYSAWELGGASIGAFIEPITAVYKSMKNKQYEEWLLDSRAHFSNKSLEKRNVLKPLIKLIKNGEGCGIVIDTSLNKREGLEVDFLGKKIRQTATPAFLARKYNAAIIPITIRTDDEENYTLMLFDEIPVEKTDDEQADLQKATQLQADWLNKLVLDEPKFWFWVHRRFKSEYPEIYKK